MNSDVVINEDRAPARAWLLLGLLAAVALGGALLVSLVVPPEWSDPLAAIRPPGAERRRKHDPGTGHGRDPRHAGLAGLPALRRANGARRSGAGQASAAIVSWGAWPPCCSCWG